MSECISDNVVSGQLVVSDVKERNMSSRIRPTVSGRVWGGNTEAKAEKGARDNHARGQWWERTFRNMGPQAQRA